MEVCVCVCVCEGVYVCEGVCERERGGGETDREREKLDRQKDIQMEKCYRRITGSLIENVRVCERK